MATVVRASPVANSSAAGLAESEDLLAQHSGAATAEDILESLFRVVEPNRGATIVDLGLVYGVAVEGRAVTIEMTLPDASPADRERMAKQIEAVLRRRHPDLTIIETVWTDDPPWREDFITMEGWQQLQNPLLMASDLGASPDSVLETLHQVIDPELGVNIVDLGLVYEIKIEDGAVRVIMTLTTPGCPLHESIEAAVTRSVEIRHPEVAGVIVDLVWEPPWDTDMITDEGRRQLSAARW